MSCVVTLGAENTLSVQFSGLLLSEPVIGYLECCSGAAPTLSHTRAWLLRHEHHLIYLLLRLAHRSVRSNSRVLKPPHFTCSTSSSSFFTSCLFMSVSSNTSIHFSQVPVCPEVAKRSSLYHQGALVLLPWLLPGSEYVAYELLSTVIFSRHFIS